MGKEEGTDIGYWESLLSELKAHLARARLKDKHRENLTNKLEMLKAEQTQEEMLGVKAGESTSRESPIPSKASTEDEDETAGGLLQYPKRMEEQEVKDTEVAPTQEFLNGNYSPTYICELDIELGSIIILEEEE